MLIRQATLLDGRVADVRLAERITEVAPILTPVPGEMVVEAGGGTLLPGLHDHHLHVRAAAAAVDSVTVGPPVVRTASDFARVLARAAAGADGWIRAVGYHESVAGDLDRRALDAVCPSTPLRVQHRSGALWMLNSAALDRIGAADHPDGRLPSTDHRLVAIPHRHPDLRMLGRRLARYGVTGVTDATPDLGAEDLAALRKALPQNVFGLSPGKRILADDQLDLEDLADWIGRRHSAGEPVAVHCVTAAQLVVTIAALRAVGSHPADRIEHAAMVPDDTLEDLATLGVTVVTQPNFLAERGEAYRRDIPVAEHSQLWRIGSLQRAGVTVAGSTDAPFGDLDPWAAMRAAVNRTAAEAVSPRQALQMFLGSAEKPGRPREIAPGQPGDVCLLSAPPGQVLAELDAAPVVLAAVRGAPLDADADRRE